MRCIHCGSDIRDTAKFCVRCGKQVPRCPTCSNVILTRARFCKYDGTQIPEEILNCLPEESPKTPEFVPPVLPITFEEEIVREPEPVPVPKPVAAPEPIPEPKPVVTPKPVAKQADPVQIRYCVKCGSVCTDGMKLCPKCRQKTAPKPAPAGNTCIRCGKPCGSGEVLCPDCRVEKAVGKKSKRISVLVIVLVILLLITAGIAGALIWRELSRGDDAGYVAPVQTTHGRQEENIPTDPTTAPTAAPTTVPTTAPTEAPTEPTLPATPLEYWVEYCDTQYLTRSDLISFDAGECRLARNAIFAKSGRMFQDETLQAYFNQFSWYVPRVAPENFTNSMLNDIQLYNLELILEYEESCGYR